MVKPETIRHDSIHEHRPDSVITFFVCSPEGVSWIPWPFLGPHRHKDSLWIDCNRARMICQSLEPLPINVNLDLCSGQCPQRNSYFKNLGEVFVLESVCQKLFEIEPRIRFHWWSVPSSWFSHPYPRLTWLARYPELEIRATEFPQSYKKGSNSSEKCFSTWTLMSRRTSFLINEIQTQMSFLIGKIRIALQVPFVVLHRSVPSSPLLTSLIIFRCRNLQ